MPKIRVYQWNHTFVKEIECTCDETLSKVLYKYHIPINTACNGKGICKKCKVLLKEQIAEEKKQKWVLACQYNVVCDIDIYLPKAKEDNAYPKIMADVSAIEKQTQKKANDFEKQKVTKEKSIKNLIEEPKAQQMNAKIVHLAIDIGTTTLAFAIIEDTTKKVLDMSTANNPQRVYGLDVISRMQASDNGKLEILKACIWETIEEKIADMLQKQEENNMLLDTIVIAANTPMQHLLMGYSCKTLSKAPFTPYKVSHDKIPLKDVYVSQKGFMKRTKLVLLPAASAFVGGDILSGLYALDLDFNQEDFVLFLDLGTNGEMVYKTKGHFFATATAAGPALEAANITAGVAGIEGAISNVNIIANHIQIKTIGNKTPIGICGSGVIDTVYELFKAGWMDASGAIVKEELNQEKKIVIYPQTQGQRKVSETREIAFTQEDIRQVQMAKAAIASGMEILIKEAGQTPSDVKKVLLAGGLGYSLNVFKAAGIGLILPLFRQKTKAVGNTSLLGAIKYIQNEDGQKRLEDLTKKITTFNLAQKAEFEETYIRNLNF